MIRDPEACAKPYPRLDGTREKAQGEEQAGLVFAAVFSYAGLLLAIIVDVFLRFGNFRLYTGFV